MTERNVVLVPYRPSSPEREQSWKIISAYYSLLRWPAYVADEGGDPFSLAASVNKAAEMAGDWDTALIINTDCVAPLNNILEGMRHAYRTDRLTLPHDELILMKPGSYPIPPVDTSWKRYRVKENASKRVAPAGAIAMPRTVWDRIGGYDERLIGWGFEDAALLIQAGEFDRMHGPLFHYWHPTARVVVPAAKAVWESEYKGRAAIEGLWTPGQTE